MTCSFRRLWLFFAVLMPALGTVRAEDPPAPAANAPVIQPGPTAATPPQIATPQQIEGAPETIIPEMQEPIWDPGYRTYSDTPGRFSFGYGMYDGYAFGAPGFNFGYGYRPLGYTFWPRYGDYTDFGRYFQDPYQFYARPYTWHPYWSYQRYRQYPIW